VSFKDDRRLAIAILGMTGALVSASSGLIDPGVGPGSLLTIEPELGVLFAVAPSGPSSIIDCANRADLHAPRPFALPGGYCPSALHAAAGVLHVGSSCGTQGVLSVPLDAEGDPAGGETFHATPGCTPTHLDVLGGHLLVACEDSPELHVVGLD
jgi:hypothetical protein